MRHGPRVHWKTAHIHVTTSRVSVSSYSYPDSTVNYCARPADRTLKVFEEWPGLIKRSFFPSFSMKVDGFQGILVYLLDHSLKSSRYFWIMLAKTRKFIRLNIHKYFKPVTIEMTPSAKTISQKVFEDLFLRYIRPLYGIPWHFGVTELFQV